MYSAFIIKILIIAVKVVPKTNLYNFGKINYRWNIFLHIWPKDKNIFLMVYKKSVKLSLGWRCSLKIGRARATDALKGGKNKKNGKVTFCFINYKSKKIFSDFKEQSEHSKLHLLIQITSHTLKNFDALISKLKNLSHLWLFRHRYASLANFG